MRLILLPWMVRKLALLKLNYLDTKFMYYRMCLLASLTLELVDNTLLTLRIPVRMALLFALLYIRADRREFLYLWVRDCPKEEMTAMSR